MSFFNKFLSLFLVLSISSNIFCLDATEVPTIAATFPPAFEVLLESLRTREIDHIEHCAYIITHQCIRNQSGKLLAEAEVLLNSIKSQINNNNYKQLMQQIANQRILN